MDRPLSHDERSLALKTNELLQHSISNSAAPDVALLATLQADHARLLAGSDEFGKNTRSTSALVVGLLVMSALSFAAALLTPG